MFFEAGILIMLLITSIEDIRKKEILLWEIIAIAALSVTEGVTRYCKGSFDAADFALSLIPGAILLILAFLTRQEVGCGDGLMVLAAGPGLGFFVTLTGLSAAVFISGIFSGIFLVMKKAKRKTKIPFAPFLTIGMMAATIGYRGIG